MPQLFAVCVVPGVGKLFRFSTARLAMIVLVKKILCVAVSPAPVHGEEGWAPYLSSHNRK
jgi:hypothetical protein